MKMKVMKFLKVQKDMRSHFRRLEKLMEIEKMAKKIAAEIRPFSVRWMKLKFAATYIGINKDKLKRLAVCGEIVGYPDPDNGRGDWIFDRESLDSYRLNQQRNFQNKLLELERNL